MEEVTLCWYPFRLLLVFLSKQPWHLLRHTFPWAGFHCALQRHQKCSEFVSAGRWGFCTQGKVVRPSTLYRGWYTAVLWSYFLSFPFVLNAWTNFLWPSSNPSLGFTTTLHTPSSSLLQQMCRQVLTASNKTAYMLKAPHTWAPQWRGQLCKLQH